MKRLDGYNGIEFNEETSASIQWSGEGQEEKRLSTPRTFFQLGGPFKMDQNAESCKIFYNYPASLRESQKIARLGQVSAIVSLDR